MSQICARIQKYSHPAGFNYFLYTHAIFLFLCEIFPFIKISAILNLYINPTLRCQNLEQQSRLVQYFMVQLGSKSIRLSRS